LAIARDPGSFAAERAKEILTQQGKEYVPPAETNTVLSALQNVFGQTLVPVFTPPERMITAQLQIQGSVFPYGSEFSGVAAITNHSSEPLVISDYSLFKGHIRVDAVISGDINKNIPNLVFRRLRGAFLIEPGRSILVRLRLITGELRNTLLTYPQASLDIEFTLYLDPVVTNDGKVANRLVYIQPGRASIKRPGIELTGKYLRNEFNSISTAPVDQKIKTARLFTGLLKEQYAMSNRKLPPMDHELISPVAENMNNTKWPVRLMAVYLLTTIPDSQFNQVLDWTAKNDPSKTVRDMAIVLGRDMSGRQGQ
jgi:hypothetical protein